MSDSIHHELIPYPDQILDDEGYPTQKALDYIGNWSIIYKDDETFVGQYFSKEDKEQELVDFIQQLWYYDDGIEVHEHFIEIHTLGWSGNEEVIRILKKTWWWNKYHWITRTGGHYYFNTADTTEDPFAKHDLGEPAILKHMLGNRA